MLELYFGVYYAYALYGAAIFGWGCDIKVLHLIKSIIAIYMIIICTYGIFNGTNINTNDYLLSLIYFTDLCNIIKSVLKT
jgi:hypothetical protein